MVSNMTGKESMPILFLAHGSPMNAIETNSYTETLEKLGESLPQPRAILMISAHWMTTGTWVTHMMQPKTIHDFSGFPKELYDVQYPAPGSPLLAERIQAVVTRTKISPDDDQWGLDHGAWSVLKYLYPSAKVPVVQLSLDMTQPMEFHFQLGEALKILRQEEVLILGSGNIVHNLREISWETSAKPFDWAVAFDNWVRDQLIARNFQALVKNAHAAQEGRRSIPTWDHYLPLLYILGASEVADNLTFPYEGMQNASISMRCIKFG